MFRSLLPLLPVAAMLSFGQTPPPPAAPPEVDQALRARVSEFFQDYVDAHFRQAEALVAEDSKDYYFASSKPHLKSFKIDGVTWSSEFTKARVTVVVEREWEMQPLVKGLSAVPLATSWKLEDGKWVWYNDIAPNAWVTPMGASDVGALKKAQANPQLPPNMSPDAIAAAGRQILEGSGSLDKTAVKLAADKPSSEEVVFTNQTQGFVKISVEGGNVNGLSAVLDKTELAGGAKATLKISYTPMGQNPPDSVRIRVEPLQKIFVIHINVGS